MASQEQIDLYAHQLFDVWPADLQEYAKGLDFNLQESHSMIAINGMIGDWLDGRSKGELKQLRLDLEKYDELFSTVHPGSTDEEWQPFLDAQDKLYDNLEDKYHLLFDEIDRLQKENEALRSKP